jgi:predicted RNase H-like HicB family nuclease
MKKKITTTRNKSAKRMRPAADHYLYRVGWSMDDEAYVARVAEFPSLAAHGNSQDAALRSLQQVVKTVLKDMFVSNETTPRPLG